jgi:hypothetical protein
MPPHANQTESVGTVVHDSNDGGAADEAGGQTQQFIVAVLSAAT